MDEAENSLNTQFRLFVSKHNINEEIASNNYMREQI